MTTYTATFRSDGEYASHDFDAETPEQALALARTFYADGTTELWFEHYDEAPVNEIVIQNDDCDELAVWQDEDLRLRLAASDLLEALRFCDMTLADLEASKRKGYIQQAKLLARAAIAKAKEGAA